ncbi:MAG: hypothetical protein DRP14_03160 [Candidatus Aenigmatarchaeota archaeon]|nr:MAG: hypothetical protein DRP14_03160 [Candidatus Aenigmarchaeota archaeon]
MSIQTHSDKKTFSQLRQSLRRLSDEVRQLINPFFSDKPLIKGSVYELKTKCGKPGCKCAKGELHHRMVVSASEKGKTKLRAIPHGYLIEVQTKVRRYQELRRVRVGLIEVHKKMLQVMDEMEAMRREEMPVCRKKPTSQ